MSLSLTPFTFPTWPTLDRELDRDFARMHRLVNEATRHLTPSHDGVYHRQPNYSYEEHNNRAYIEVELPGVPKENVSINLQGNTLAITANRYKPGATDVHVTEEVADAHAEKESAKDTKHVEHVEQPKPTVVYHLKLKVGHKYDADNIHASMEGDGLLKISVPMRHRDIPRSIQIQSANM